MTRAQLFAAIRPFAPGHSFTSTMVEQIDLIADAFGLPRIEGGGDALAKAVALIKEFEGCKLTAYPDPGSGGDPWTVGWGSTGAGIAKGVTWTQAMADARLSADVSKFMAKVEAEIATAASPTNDNQLAALTSLAYNIGIGNLQSSTLLKMHKAGDYTGARDQFARWNRASGKEMAGLTRRRAAEAKVYGS